MQLAKLQRSQTAKNLPGQLAKDKIAIQKYNLKILQSQSVSKDELSSQNEELSFNNPTYEKKQYISEDIRLEEEKKGEEKEEGEAKEVEK